MLRSRIIPCLLVHDGGLVKTVRFQKPKYVGDPINAVRIFNEKRVDELIVVDIDATRRGTEPDYDLVASLAAECRMPLCYGGGVTATSQVRRLVGLGVEKVAMSAGAIANPDLIGASAACVGSQSVVVVLDVKRVGLLRRYSLVTHNATRRSQLDPVTFAKKAQHLGAGEIMVNSVDHDGQMDGYDLDLISRIVPEVSVPVTALGGAGSMDHVRGLVSQHAPIGAAAGSLFVFKGKYRAVLINYPSLHVRDQLFDVA